MHWMCNLGHATPSPSMHLQPALLQLKPNLKPVIMIHELENPTDVVTTSAPTSITNPTPAPRLGTFHALLLSPNTSYPAHLIPPHCCPGAQCACVQQWADAEVDPMLAAGVSCPTLSGGMSCKANVRRRSAPTRTTKASAITLLMSTVHNAQKGQSARTWQ